MIREEIKVGEYKIGISQWKVAGSPSKLTTLGLGSCVGIALYDPVLKLGGLSHIMLPDSTQFKNNDNAGKFANTAIPILLKEMLAEGAKKSRIEARIAGGASMFKSAEKNGANIGRRNVEKTLEVLEDLGIKVKSKEVGGNKGRTMILDTQEGIVWLRLLGNKTKML